MGFQAWAARTKVHNHVLVNASNSDNDTGASVVAAAVEVDGAQSRGGRGRVSAVVAVAAEPDAALPAVGPVRPGFV